MNIVYLDCSSGISGDMFIGALVDAGVPAAHLRRELSKLPLEGFSLRVRHVLRCGIRAKKADVTMAPAAATPRKWRDVRKILTASTLDAGIRRDALSLFQRLFEVEAGIHGKNYDQIHLHELGAVDCIVDVVSVLVGMRRLGVTKVVSSPVNLGSGSVKTEHGDLPVPSPATVELLKSAVVYSRASGYELTTPTGALLLSHFAEEYGDMPAMRVRRQGFGAGRRNDAARPNVLRILVGVSPSGAGAEEVFLIETNIDDMNPQWYDHVFDLLFQGGALDVYLTPVVMKKQRPGVKISVLAFRKDVERMREILLCETTSIGVRSCRYERVALKREEVRIRTRYGMVRFKKTFRDGKVHALVPEYEDCRTIAVHTGKPLKAVVGELARMAASWEKASNR